MLALVWKFIFLIPFFASGDVIPDVDFDVTDVAFNIV
jgi:hypothetical protein